ncbi:hypothetical protein [Paenibacillus thalictri]|uniref:hypothetical protein n=1 Tax=Paenibacillus thalictri TaxID=2527873 RepID=UPI0013EEF616|nr:hypothetical protein [Paenibacillus thalictri]
MTVISVAAPSAVIAAAVGIAMAVTMVMMTMMAIMSAMVAMMTVIVGAVIVIGKTVVRICPCIAPSFIMLSPATPRSAGCPYKQDNNDNSYDDDKR